MKLTETARERVGQEMVPVRQSGGSGKTEIDPLWIDGVEKEMTGRGQGFLEFSSHPTALSWNPCNKDKETNLAAMEISMRSCTFQA